MAQENEKLHSLFNELENIYNECSKKEKKKFLQLLEKWKNKGTFRENYVNIIDNNFLIRTDLDDFFYKYTEHPELIEFIRQYHVDTFDEFIDFRMSLEQKYNLCRYDFSNLKVLDLRYQDLDDNFIKELSSFAGCASLRRIDLSHNPKINDISLDYILQSTSIGSIRDRPTISARYGIPSCNIEIDMSDTGISEEKRNTKLTNFDHYVKYTDAMFPETTQVVKILKIDPFRD